MSWDVELYGELLKIGGGKERLVFYLLFSYFSHLAFQIILVSTEAFTLNVRLRNYGDSTLLWFLTFLRILFITYKKHDLVRRKNSNYF